MEKERKQERFKPSTAFGLISNLKDHLKTSLICEAERD